MTAPGIDEQIALLAEFLEPVEIVDNVRVDIDWIQLDATDAKEILASLRELQACQWQPIETAPKYISVLVAGRAGHIGVGWRDSTTWTVKWDSEPMMRTLDEQINAKCISVWRPLPAPPIDAAGKEGK